MAKKPSAKASKSKPKAKARAGGQKKSPTQTRRTKESSAKYEQPGAPWWKQHLP